jgi:serine/threonine protein phosphatase PrpC
LIIRGNTGHIFHVGDSRLYRLRDDDWECLTKDHALITRHGNQLTRALGMDWRVDIDYTKLTYKLVIFIYLSTDGIHSLSPTKNYTPLLPVVAKP